MSYMSEGTYIEELDKFAQLEKELKKYSNRLLVLHILKQNFYYKLR